ncbi:ParA family protein [Pseudonocardia alaniniphila]|uniref:AAA family ATPase n=1 Tax=Pseudonocardia alaniniphila TaxID=75291 RepID=A0ABS9TVL4_9PSEU|nr:AAA family ATPase [Pseudonocardia alaniniphila]MCH6172281.1 AAA family ATPase [Pseudonocardia alaniniphila]
MTKIVALFNNKGGVSKTTTTFNLGWMLAERGKRVVIVDADPQCNLTGMVMGLGGMQDLEDFYETQGERNIRSALQPVFESRPRSLQGVDCLHVAGCDGLYLLPGHIQLAEYEVQLGIAQELSGSIQALSNIPGSFSFLFRETAARMSADYVLVDLSPGLGSINQNLVATSDYLIVPTTPDIFSVMAVDSLARVIPRWITWAQRASELAVFRDADYPFADPAIKFLGAVIQRYNLRRGDPTRAFKDYFYELDRALTENLVPALISSGASLDEAAYNAAGMDGPYRLASIPDFNSLIAISQQERKPVFALTRADVGRAGAVWDVTEKNILKYRDIFDKIVDRLELLTAS